MNPMNKVSQVRIGSPLLSGLLYAFVFMGIATVVVSLLVMLADQDESALTGYAYGIHAAAILVGSFMSGKRAGFKGWYYGGILGFLYALIVWVVGFLSLDRGIDIRTLLFVAASFLAGAIGGIVGVNARK